MQRAETSDRLDEGGREPGLPPRADAAIQWWYVHGALDAPSGAGIHFMVAFFEVRGEGEIPPGHMLLVNVLDARTGALARLSRIDAAIVEHHRATARRFVDANFGGPLSGLVLDRHMRGAGTEALAHGIETVADGAQIADGPLSVRWGTFALSGARDGLRLVLPFGAGEVANLRLTPRRPWLCADGRDLDPFLAPPYGYDSCSRVAVSGDVGGRAVTGRAWIDRQWGRLDGWFLAERPGALHLLGWDWLGLSFDDGRDLRIARQHAVGQGPCGEGYAVCFDDASARHVDAGIVHATLRAWTSPRTGVVYPLDRRITIAGMAADIEVLAMSDDQEIPVFGAPAIWQGAVRAKGALAGREVRGTGRLELFGYGYPRSLADLVARRLRRLWAR